MPDVRRTFLVLAATYGIAAAVQGASAQQCADIDPSNTIASAAGDFEFTVDPNDPAQHLIYLNHLANGPSSVVVALLDGATTQVVPNSLTTIATNFYGLRHINGPEFVMPPGHGLGVLYRDLTGVHGVFRPVSPKAWNDFSLTLDGQPAGTKPPRISSSYEYAYETGNLPFNQNTYALFKGPCTFRCFASVLGGKPTDAYKAFQRDFGLTIPTIESVVQSERDYVIYADACTKNASANGVCGIYEATIDPAGGFQPNSLHLLTTLPTTGAQRVGRVPLDSGIHPVTGSTVFFIEATHDVGTTVDVYERKVVGGPLTLIASVPALDTDHFRVITSPTQMIMHYLVRPLTDRPEELVGSYEITVNASGANLVVGQPHKIGTVSGGAEVEYIPGAGQFAIFSQISTDKPPIKIQRCFFQAE